MEFFEALMAWCWYDEEGRTKAADELESKLLPFLLIGCASVVVIGSVLLLQR